MREPAPTRRRVLHALASLPLAHALSWPGIPALATPAGSTGAAGSAGATALRARTPDLLRALDAQCNAAGVPAFGIAIVDAEGDLLVEARGRLPGLDRETPFRIGSITKTFTALAMLRLAERQHIDIDRTPLRTLAADASFSNPWEAETPLTVAMLLEHTAGFGELTRREWDYSAAAPISLRDGLALDPASRTCRWRPGVQHVYSNASPGLVALAIERLQPQDFPAFVRAEVLRPLGLRHTGFLPGEASARRLVPGFRADGRTAIPYWHQHILAYGALHASPQDMALLLRTLLEDARDADERDTGEPGAGGERDRTDARSSQPTIQRSTTRLLQPRSIARMLRPRTSLAARAGLALGHGLGIYGSARGGFVFDGHGGDGDGYLSRFGLLRRAGRGYFLVIDTDDPPLFARLRAIVEGWLTQDLAPQPAPAAPASASHPAVLGRWAGHYRRAGTRFRTPVPPSAVAPARMRAAANAELLVSATDRGLQLRGALNLDLLATGAPGQFRTSAEPVPTSIFAADRAELYLLGELGNFVRTRPSAIAR